LPRNAREVDSTLVASPLSDVLDRRGVRPLLALAAGCMLWLAAPNFDLWWLSLGAWALVLWICDGQSLRRVAAYGLLMGTCVIFGGFTWMTELLGRFAGMSLAPALGVHLLFSLYHGLLWALPITLAHGLQRRGAGPAYLTLPLCWAAAELTFPQLFEVHVACFWARHPQLIQLAEYIGAVGVGAVMVLANGLLYGLISRWSHPRARIRLGGALLALSIGVPLFGVWRMEVIDARVDERPTLAIGIVQGNFGIESRRRLRRESLHALQRMSTELEAEGAEVVVWGETTFPYGGFFRDSVTDLDPSDRRRVRRGFTVPVIFGLPTRDRREKRRRMWNTVWVLDGDDQLGDRYDKNYPLWFGEWVPLVDPDWYLDRFPNASYIHVGEQPAALRVAGYRLGPLICYEDLLADFSRDVVDRDVHALVAMNNESWFGRSRAQPAHLNLAILRTVEHRKALARSVNAGISAYIDPNGRVVQELAITDSDSDGYQGPGGFVANVPMMEPEARTFYARVGSGWRWLSWLCLLGLALAARIRRGPAPPK